LKNVRVAAVRLARNVTCIGMKLIGVLGLAVLASVVAACGDDEPSTTGELPPKDGLLFVLRGEGSSEGDRISVDAQTVDWFFDRPSRRAGRSEVRDLVASWSAFGFDEIPPNAALAGEAVDAVVRLSDPREDGETVSFAYTTIENGSPVPDGDLGELSVFIDDTSGICEASAGNWVFTASDGATCAEAEEVFGKGGAGGVRMITTSDGVTWSCSRQGPSVVEIFTCTSTDGLVGFENRDPGPPP
jgi:hypothetical protein